MEVSDLIIMENVFILTKNFILQEFIPEDIFSDYGATAIRFISPKLPQIAQGIKEYFNNSTVTINNWFYDAGLQYRGFRPPDCEIGSELSAHKRGMAIDFNVKDFDDKEVQKIIKANQTYFKAIGITLLKDDTYGYTHVSAEWTGIEELLVI